jgi:uncharacterized membrane protein YvbJ
MECLKCKTRNNYYYKFCYNCGVQLDSTNSDIIQYETSYNAKILLNDRRKLFNPYYERKKKRLKILFAVFFSSVIIAAALYLVLISK